MSKPGDTIRAGWKYYEVVGHPRVTKDTHGPVTFHPQLREVNADRAAAH